MSDRRYVIFRISGKKEKPFRWRAKGSAHVINTGKGFPDPGGRFFFDDTGNTPGIVTIRFFADPEPNRT